MWLHVNSGCKRVVACLYQEVGITGIMFSHQTGWPITVWAYKLEGLQQGFFGMVNTELQLGKILLAPPCEILM